MLRGGGQIIPTTRRTVYQSFLMAAPALMEPMYKVEVQYREEINLDPSEKQDGVLSIIKDTLKGRRGRLHKTSPKPGTNFYTAICFLPVIDSFGLETELRRKAPRHIMCHQIFDHWAIVPGDPLEKDVEAEFNKLKPAREFMVKTRRKKGLADDVSITKYFEDERLRTLAIAKVR